MPPNEFAVCIAHLNTAQTHLADAAKMTEAGTTERESLQVRTLTWQIHAFVSTIRDNCDIPAQCSHRPGGTAP